MFDVTYNAGTTTSLKYAEENLKKHADDDLCYFKTYLQPHYLQYESAIAGPNSQSFQRLALSFMDNVIYILDTRLDLCFSTL